MQERDRTSYREQRRKEQGKAARDAKDGPDDGMFFGSSPQEKKERRETKDPRKIDLKSLNLNAIDREKYDAPPQVGQTVKLIDLALDPDAFKPTKATHPADVKKGPPPPPQRSPQSKGPMPPRSRPPQAPPAGSQRPPARGAQPPGRPPGAPPPPRASQAPAGRPPQPRPPARPLSPAPKGVQPRPLKPPPPGQPPRPQRPTPKPSASPRPPQPGLRNPRPPQQRPGGGKGR